jgi:hypothetical protein
MNVPQDLILTHMSSARIPKPNFLVARFTVIGILLCASRSSK